MPPFSFWFTGSAIGALLALIVSTTTLGWAWYNAALTEQKSARSNERLKEVRGHLLGFYVRGVELRDRPLPKEISQTDFDAYVSQVQVWLNETDGWIKANLGPAASAKFMDTGAGFSFSWNRAANPVHDNIINRMTRWLENIAKMIETDAWDAKK